MTNFSSSIERDLVEALAGRFMPAVVDWSILLVDGEPGNDVTSVYYLIDHLARSKNFIVKRFEIAGLPSLDVLVADILGGLGIDGPLPPIGNGSVERWAAKLADTVAHAIEETQSRRLFVFDEFPVMQLPNGIASFIIRLATYADEELRPLLRVVLMRFPGPLPPELDDITLRYETQPFKTTDMVAVVMQIARARNWSVSEAAVERVIYDYHLIPGRTLGDQFKFLRGLLQELATASP